MRKSKNFADILAEAETEEDLKFYFIKKLNLKPSSKNYIDLYTKQILFEFKLKANFKNPPQLAKCVAQALYYIRRLKFGNDERPLSSNICVISKKFGVLFPTETFAAFYDNPNYQWDLSASSPCKKLVEDLAASESVINAHVYDLSDRNGDCMIFVQLLDNTCKKNDDSGIKKQINEKNFYQIFRYWQTFFGEAVENGRKPSEYFITDIEQGKSSLLPNCVVRFRMTGGDLVEKCLNPEYYRHFWRTYEKISDEREIIAIRQKMDRITEPFLRSYTGEYYTPIIFANKAVEYLERVVGKWWTDENFRLWDMAAGTGNLEFALPSDALKFCYISTLGQDEADYCRKSFHDATVFQFDYLNDAAEKLPKNLREDLSNPNIKWIIFINPPYGTAGNNRNQSKQIKTDVSMTAIRNSMREENLGDTSQELYAQFIYRISKDFSYRQVWLGMFSSLKYIKSGQEKNFRDKIFRCKFERGFVFNSKNFDGCDGQWPVGFLIWNLAERIPLESQIISLDVCEKHKDDGGKEFIARIAEKTFHIDNPKRFLNIWAKRSRGVKKFPPMSSGIKVAYESKTPKDMIAENFLATFVYSGNDFANQNYTSLVSGSVARHGGISVTPENFEQCMITHMVRRLPKANWLNNKDQFMQPTKKLTPEFISDAVIWSLFAPSNQTVSLRNVAYEGEIYRIRNNFFPFTLSELKTWQCSSFEMVRAIDSAREDRFAALWLKNHGSELSAEALAVLSAGRELYNKFFAEIGRLDVRRWKIEAWDAGFYQIRNALGDAEVLREPMRALGAKLEPQIYELGFLRDEVRYFD